MAIIRTGNVLHDLTLASLEGVRQVALAAATTQAQARSADIAYATGALASSIGMNNAANVTLFRGMLRELQGGP